MDEDFGEDILERGVAVVKGKKKGKKKQMLGAAGNPWSMAMNMMRGGKKGKK